MSENIHARARHLLAQQRIETISAEEQSWLSAHLNNCESCLAVQGQTANAIATFRSVNIELPKNLAARTQLRVRLRAEEMNDREPGRKLLWALVGISWTLGVATAPFVWRGFEWVGQEFGLPKIILATGMALWWLVPGLLITGAVVMQKQKAERGAE